MFKILSEEDTLLMQDKQIPRKRTRKEVFSQAHLCLYNPPSQHALKSNLRNFYEKREIGVASTTFPTTNVKLISLLRVLVLYSSSPRK